MFPSLTRPLCNVVLCCPMFSCVSLCWAILGYIALCFRMLFYVALCCTLLGYIALCFAIMAMWPKKKKTETPKYILTKYILTIEITNNDTWCRAQTINLGCLGNYENSWLQIQIVTRDSVVFYKCLLYNKTCRLKELGNSDMLNNRIHFLRETQGS